LELSRKVCKYAGLCGFFVRRPVQENMLLKQRTGRAASREKNLPYSICGADENAVRPDREPSARLLSIEDLNPI